VEKGRTVLHAKYVIPQGITLWQLYKYHELPPARVYK